MQQKTQLRDQATGRILVPHMEVANSLWRQTGGLMGRKTFPPDTGLLIPHCNGIHTAFVRFPIDVIFLDSASVVVKVIPALGPWRIIGFVRGAKSVVELPAGTLQQKRITVGQQLEIASQKP